VYLSPMLSWGLLILGSVALLAIVFKLDSLLWSLKAHKSDQVDADIRAAKARDQYMEALQRMNGGSHE
jgi:hypothetical protein